MRDIRQPTAVVIDFDNTLYEYEPCNRLASTSVYEFLSQELNVSKDEVRRAWLVARDLVKAQVGCVASSHSRILYAQQALIGLGFGGKPGLALQVEQIYWSVFMSEMKPIEGAIDFIASVRFKRIPIVLVTDLTSQIQIRKLIYLGWETLFDFVVTSELVGSEKQTGKPFDYALNLLSAEEREYVWFIGDEPYDVPDLLVFDHAVKGQHARGFLRTDNIGKNSQIEYFANFIDLDKRLSSLN